MSYLIYRPRPGFLLMLLLIAATLPVWFVRTGHTADPCAIPNFSVAPNIFLTEPRALVGGDFNKDGKPDLAVAGATSQGIVSILLGTGNGGFAAPTTFAGGHTPTYIATGDLNGDGNLDLVLANESHVQGDLSVLMGNGAGGFGPQTFISLTSSNTNSRSSVAITDVNGDGKADVLLAIDTLNAVMVLLGDGTGKLTLFKSFSSGGLSDQYRHSRFQHRRQD